MERRTVARAVAAASALLALGFAGCQSSSGGSSAAGAGSGKIEGSEFEEAPPTSRSSGAGSSAALETIYFAFDRFDIRSDAVSTLRGNASAIKGSDWPKITIEGHCDERGSEEYNLALGERRANATKRYLMDLGVPSAKLATVSFGEARPAVPGHDESAWRYNRRSEFVVR